MILNKMVVPLEGPFGALGENCKKQFTQHNVEQSSGDLGPLCFQVTNRDYPDWGLELVELRIRNFWGATLSLHKFSADFSFSSSVSNLQSEKYHDRIMVQYGDQNRIVFLPPHYWHGGVICCEDGFLKVIPFQAGEANKPLSLAAGNERLFLILQVHESSETKPRKLWDYLGTKRFRQFPGYKVMMSHMHTKYSDGKGTLLENAECLKGPDIDIGLWTDHDAWLDETGLAKLPEETTLASDENFLAVSRPELSSNLHIIPDQKGKLQDHACYLTPKPVNHFASLKKDGKHCSGEGAVDIVAQNIVENENGVCWLAHPGLSRTPKELMDGWTQHVSMMEWSNYEWIIGKSCSSIFRHCVDFGQLLFHKLDMLLNQGFEVGVIGGVDFHGNQNADYVFSNGIVNYLKNIELNVPSVVACLKERDFFVSTGEILIEKCELKSGEVVLEIDTLFPLRNIIVATDKGKINYSVKDLDSNGEIKIPLNQFNPEKWWRTEIWDIANNPVFTQPVIIR
jgi:hypothetical protein